MTPRRTTPTAIEGLGEALAEQARAYLVRWYGSEGKRTADAVAKAIEGAAGKLADEKPAAAANRLVEVATEAFIGRKGERERGVATDLARVLELRALSGR